MQRSWSFVADVVGKPMGPIFKSQGLPDLWHVHFVPKLGNELPFYIA